MIVLLLWLSFAATPPAAPQPSLEGLDPAVQTQLREARELVETLEEPDPAARRLLGRLYHAYDLRDAARGVYEQILASDDDPEIRYLAAVLAEKDGRFSDAAQELQKVVAMRPDLGAAHQRLGEALLHEALAADDADRLADARSAFERADDLGVGAAASFGLARIAAAQEQSERAVELFQIALLRDPAADGMRYPLALALRDLGRVDEARAELAKRGKRLPSFVDPIYESLRSLTAGAAADQLRATRALRRGDPQTAMQLFRRALETDPRGVQARIGLSQTLQRLGRAREALDPLREALQIEPENPLIHFELAGLFARLGGPDQSLRALQRTVELAPDFTDAHFNLGVEWERRGDSEQAAVHWTKVVDSDPDDVEARRRLARMLGQTLRFEEAAKHFEFLIDHPQASTDDHIGRVMAWTLAGRCDLAEEALQRSLREVPNKDSLFGLEVHVRQTCAAPDSATPPD